MNERTAAARAGDDDARGADTGADDTSIEERARRIGWVPKDEFRGDPAKWSEAADFLERGERTLPILLERNRKLDDAVARLERTNRDMLSKFDAVTGELKESRQTFQEFRQSTANVERRAYERARAEILAERDAAVAAADPAAFKAADAQLVELDKTAPKPVETDQRREDRRDEREDRDDRQSDRTERKPTAQEPAPVSEAAKQWIEENAWFKTDAKAGAKAVALHSVNLAMGMSEEESLADVRASMEAVRPDLFEDGREDTRENPRRGAPGSVHTPTNGAGRRQRASGRTFDDLPKDAKDAYARFHKQDPKFTKEAYLADYAWDAQ